MAQLEITETTAAWLAKNLTAGKRLTSKTIELSKSKQKRNTAQASGQLDELMFSKTKQVRDGLSAAQENARAMIDSSAKLAALKRLAKQTEGVTVGVERSNNHVSLKGWIEFPGHRHYMRSSWERNYARYLEFLKANKEIKAWDYEPQRFDFPVKRGNNSYLPDFRIIEKDGSETWVEVKGYMNQGSRTKMKRFMKYYPDKKLVLIDAKQYAEIKKQCRKLIPGWE